MLSRRAFVGKLAAGAAVAGAAMMGRAEAVSVRGEAPVPSGGVGPEPQAPAAGSAPGAGTAAAEASAPSAPPPWELIAPLRAGTAVGPGWRVAELSAVVDGSCVLTLANRRGRTQRVHLCRNDGRPHGVVYTQRFDLLVMNGGQGDLPTDEGLAQAVAAVAHALAANERRPAAVVTALLPHGERAQRFGAAAAQLR
jgi:hypothetical protein